MIKAKKGHRPDYIFLSCLIVLVVFGIVVLSSASSDLGKIKFNDTYYYVKHQLMYGLSLGIIGFLFTSFFYYRYLQKIAVPLLIVSLILLILVFTPLGFRHAGSNRWINLGPFSMQPAELLKFTFIVYIAAWLSPRSKSEDSYGFRQKNLLEGLIPFLIICGVVGFLIVIQPATTTVLIILFASIILYFVSGARISYVLGIILLGLLALALIVLTTQYRFERVSGFVNSYLHPSAVNTTVQGYHLNEALIAIGSGGLTGVGFGKSTTKYKYLPEPIGDSIFAVVAEELGFIGAAALILFFIFFFMRGLMIAKKSRDQFAKFTVIGFISVIAFQTFIHIAAISGIFPLTGVPLPFISYGGTSLAIFLTMAGTIVNISKYTG